MLENEQVYSMCRAVTASCEAHIISIMTSAVYDNHSYTNTSSLGETLYQLQLFWTLWLTLIYSFIRTKNYLLINWSSTCGKVSQSSSQLETVINYCDTVMAINYEFTNSKRGHFYKASITSYTHVSKLFQEMHPSKKLWQTRWPILELSPSLTLEAELPELRCRSLLTKWMLADLHLHFLIYCI